MDVDVQFISPVPHQVGVLEEAPSNKHCIDRTLIQIALSLLSRGNHSYRSHDGASTLDSFLDSSSPRNLIPRAGVDLLTAIQTTTSDIEQIYAFICKDLAKLCCFVNVPLGQRWVKVKVVCARYTGKKRIV